MFDVIKYKWVTIGISIALAVISIVSLLTLGLKKDIDFTGGTTMNINIGTQFDNKEVTDLITSTLGKSPSTVQKSGDNQTELVIKILPLETEERAKLFEAFKTKYNLPQEALLSSDNVSATIGSEIGWSALWASIWSIILMLLYVSFRFELISGVSAIISLIANVVILLGVYSVFRIPINSTFIAAILTIVGYSINDTIIIFDRIRENTRILKKTPFSEIVNKSVWQSFTRSVNTSLTTLLTIIILYVVGVAAIKEFALPIIIGIFVGTLSSIFVASPIWASFRGDGKLTKTA